MGGIPTRQELRDALAARHGDGLQAKLEAARVAVCGLGGLGSNVATALARAGVGHLQLIDFDRVEITNLNRQQYRVSQIGLLKTEAMRENLAEIAPWKSGWGDGTCGDWEGIHENWREKNVLCLDTCPN